MKFTFVPAPGKQSTPEASSSGTSAAPAKPPAGAGMPLFLRERARRLSEPGSPAESQAERLAEAVVQEASSRPRGPGEASTAEGGLPAPLRHAVGPLLGLGPGDVRLHAGPEAARSAHALGARAYTVGGDIVLGADEYAPETRDGQRLLAHELVHVAQQRAATGLSPPGRRASLDISPAPGHVVHRQVPDDAPAAPAPSAGPAPAGEARPPALEFNDEQFVAFLESQPGISGSFLLPRLGGLRGMESTHPRAFHIVRARLSQRHGRRGFDVVYANDERVLRLVNNSQRIQEGAHALMAEYGESRRTAAWDTVHALLDFYMLDYEQVMARCTQLGEVSIRIWEICLRQPSQEVLQLLRSQAEEAQAAADARAEQQRQQAELGRKLIGSRVASREELLWWDEDVRLQSLLEPEWGCDTADQALAFARISGSASAVVSHRGRYYAYALNRQYGYSELWETESFAEHRTRVVPAGISAIALTTTDGYVLRPRGERFFGGDESRSPEAYLAADEKLLAEQREGLSSAQTVRLFKQMTLHLALANLAQAERRLRTELDRLYPGGLLSPREGEALQGDTARLRRLMLSAARHAAAMDGDKVDERAQEALADTLERIGEIVATRPTAALMVLNHRGEDERGPPAEGDIEDRLAGQRPGDAALAAAAELRQRLDNIEQIRRYLHQEPNSPLELTPLHPEVLSAFSSTQQLHLRVELSLHSLAHLLSRLGMSALQLGLLVAGLSTGGMAALGITAVSTGLGLREVGAGFAEARRLSAMAALDMPGGFSLATPEAASSARMWAWIGLGLSVLDVAGLGLSVRQLSRLHAVMQTPEVATLLSRTDRTFANIAEELGMSERALMRELETAQGEARRSLLARIRNATLSSRGGGRHGLFSDWEELAQYPEVIERMRRALLTSDDIGAVFQGLERAGIRNMDRDMLRMVKRYNFESVGLDFSRANYDAWRRLASGQGTVDDARYIAHEIEELRFMRQQRPGFDVLRGPFTAQEGRFFRRGWQRDFGALYAAGHQAALVAENQYLARQLSAAVEGGLELSPEVIGAADVLRSESRRVLRVGSDVLEAHPGFTAWQQQANRVVRLTPEAQRRLAPYLPDARQRLETGRYAPGLRSLQAAPEGEVTVAMLLIAIKRSPIP